MILAIILLLVSTYCIYYFFMLFWGKKEIALPNGIPQEKIKDYYHKLSYHFLAMGLLSLCGAFLAMLEVFDIWLVALSIIVCLLGVGCSIMLLYRKSALTYAKEEDDK